jgi:glutaredoxin
MEKEKIITFGVIFIILAIAGGIIFFNNFNGGTIQDTPAEEVAKWIGDHSILYVQTGCVHCVEQEELFGVNVRYLNTLDGIKEENRQKFIDAGIEGTPTWVIDGKKYVGVKTIEELKELTGYQD